MKKNLFKKMFRNIVFILLAFYAFIVLVEQQSKLIDFKDETENYYTMIQEENLRSDKLKEQKKSLTSANYIENVAREKLGLVMPNEVVFVDASM